MPEGTIVEAPNSLKRTEEFNLDEVTVLFQNTILTLASYTINYSGFVSNWFGH